MYDPNDPGPVLKTYDPNWKARWNTKHELLRALGEMPILEQDPDFRSRLTGDLCDALIGQYRYRWEYEEFLRQQHVPWFLGKEEGQIDFSIPSTSHTATPEEMQVHYRRWNDLAHELRHHLSLDPAVEWESGLFSERLTDGSMRETFDEVIALDDWHAPIRARFIVETQGSTVHVCALQRVGVDCGGLSIANGIGYVADWAARTYLPRPSALAALLGQRERLFLYQTFLPWKNGPARQPVRGHEVRRSRAKVEMVDIGVREAPPFLREEALRLHPELWKAVAAVREKQQQGKAAKL